MRALINVANQEGIETFARGLSTRGCELIASEGTAQALRKVGVPVRTLSELTDVPDILGGGMATLHPAIYGAVVARRDDPEHRRQLEQHGIEPIDIVVCNLAPVANASKREGVAADRLGDEIDIEGVALLRAAARNFHSITVLVRPRDYPRVLRELDEGSSVMVETRRSLAALAFQYTARYDSLIADRLRGGTADGQFPEELTVPLHRLQVLRYGENPHQQAALYSWGPAPSGNDAQPAVTGTDGATRAASAPAGQPQDGPTVAGVKMLHGKELGYNNVLDLDAALGTLSSFVPPTAALIKHTNPCGLACGDSPLEAYKRAHAGDSVSAYGGIVGFNREVDEATAIELSQIFYEAILAPAFAPAALDVLRRSADSRLLVTGLPIGPRAPDSTKRGVRQLEARGVSGGMLLQTQDIIADHDIQRTVVTEREPTLEEVTDLLFAWKAVQHVKSNAIVLAKKLMLVGVGAGQTSRLFSVEIALQKAKDRARGSVLASDADFPFPDGVEAACKAGVTAIIQPGGSIRDAEAIRMANRYGVAMIVTGQRHYRH